MILKIEVFTYDHTRSGTITMRTSVKLYGQPEVHKEEILRINEIQSEFDVVFDHAKFKIKNVLSRLLDGENPLKVEMDLRKQS